MEDFGHPQFLGWQRYWVQTVLSR